MKPRTEELLNMLLWSAEVLSRPTARHLTESFESWAYRNGFQRQLSALHQRRLVESDADATNERVYRLTSQGRLHALGGRDPEKRWARPWDGQWRMVLFDVATSANKQRERLRRYLRSKQLGCLQKSVWVTPDPLDEERQMLADVTVDVGSLILLEARPCAGESDADIVSEAWDFERINGGYSQHMKVMERLPRGALRSAAAARALQRWATLERRAWLDAVEADPLLPAPLLPPKYLGRRAWRRRTQVFRDARRLLETFAL